MQAKISRVSLSIFIPYPERVAEKVKADRAGLSATDRIVRGLECQAAKDFEDNLDFHAIRAEFTRKAKKIGVPVPSQGFPVPFSHEDGGVLAEVTIRGSR